MKCELKKLTKVTLKIIDLFINLNKVVILQNFIFIIQNGHILRALPQLTTPEGSDCPQTRQNKHPPHILFLGGKKLLRKSHVQVLSC